MQRRLSILGSTGSIGTQTLDVVAAYPDKFRVTALAAYHNDTVLEGQIDRFKPELAVLTDLAAAERLKRRYRGATRILAGDEGLIAAASHRQADCVLNALVGFAGLKPTIAAIEAGKTIALANKETLVAAGELITALAKDKGVAILPVDSEHSAIFQCLGGEQRRYIHKLILTASGGPFRGWTKDQLKGVTVDACLRHPNWVMGRKITVDSATLVNKGLEVIEAKWLFAVDYDQIAVVVHPESVIHSMVEYVDGTVIAQLGITDMRLPIQYALTYPERLPSPLPRLDFPSMGPLTFEAPDTDLFPGLKLAFAAGRTGGTLPCVLNAANETAVYAFLAGNISFLDIVTISEHTMKNHQLILEPTLHDLLRADEWARCYATGVIREIKY